MYPEIDKKRWVTCLLQILIGTASSFTYVLSVFIAPLMSLRGWDAGMILMTFTVAMWVGSPSIIIGGWIMEKVGLKRTMIISGVLYGLCIFASAMVTSVVAFIILQGVFGSFFMFVLSVCSLQNIGTLYPDARGKAQGIVLGGMGIGGAIIAPLAQFITDHFSVVISIGGQGVAYAVIIVVCAALITIAPKDYAPAGWTPESHDQEMITDKAQVGPDLIWHKMLRKPIFWMLFFVLLFTNIIGAMPIANASYMTQLALGVDEMTGAWILSAITVGCAIGNFFGGAVCDRLGPMKTLAIAAGINVVMGIMLGTIGLTSLLIWGIGLTILSVTYGSLTTIMPVVVMNLFGEKHFGVNYGLMGCHAMIVTTIAPQMSIMPNMTKAMFICAGFALIGMILAITCFKAGPAYIKKAWAEVDGQALAETADSALDAIEEAVAPVTEAVEASEERAAEIADEIAKED